MLETRTRKSYLSLTLFAIPLFCSLAFATGTRSNDLARVSATDRRVGTPDTSGEVQAIDTSDTAGTSGVNQSVDPSEKLASRVEKKYRSIKDLSTNFTRTLKSEIFEAEKKTKGKMYLKNPDKFRIETKEEAIVTDGEFLWTYSEQNEQVIKNKLDRSKNVFKPNQYLSNFREDYKAILAGEEKIDKVKCHKLALTPKKKDLFITKMTVWVDKRSLLAKKIEYTDMNDNQITLLFDQVKTDVGIKDSKFVFKAPEGVEELDLTE